MINIALDYDKTFTLDMEFWLMFIQLAKSRKHNVIVVTGRNESENADLNRTIAGKVDMIIYTGYKAKKRYCEDHNIKIDVWIDDHPEAIVYDGQSLKWE